jgi:three-Cys-motif partner protein
MTMQEFGSVWTEAKLNAIEKYLGFYTTALKKSFKLCYIDAFAGSGSIRIKGGNEIEGSAIRAVKFPFDKFHFFEKDKEVIETLKQKISKIPEHKDVEFHHIDCNNFLLEINKRNWAKEGWRGVIFLDPYAMDLEWTCLSEVSKTRVFDIWYLFPFMAVNRNLKKNSKIPLANKKKINLILGTNEWENILYYDSPQLNFLNENIKEKTGIENFKKFILDRFKQTFPTVSDKAVLLRNERNSPQFLLCFACSNPSKSAGDLSLRVANHILLNI